MADSNITASKLCKSCKVEKCVSFFFVDKRAKDGLYQRCKVCHGIATAKWKAANKDKVYSAHKARYTVNRAHILSVSRKWEIENKDRKNALRRKRMADDREKYNAKARKWQAENKELAREVGKASYWRTREKRLIGLRRYRQENPEILKLLEIRRRATLLQARPAWSNQFFIGEAYRLAKLREKICGGKWHVDHIVPLRSSLVCGLHVEHNLRVIPHIENMRKGNRHWPDMP